MEIGIEIARPIHDNRSTNNKISLTLRENTAGSNEGRSQCATSGPIEETTRNLNKEESDLTCCNDNNKESDFLCKLDLLRDLSHGVVGNHEGHSTQPNLQSLQEIIKLPTTDILDTTKHSAVLFKENSQGTKEGSIQKNRDKIGEH
ncbi:hypothetical protein PVK06_004396 [Gossypium arboreum]|uniref:Uncharacterized protein n=1 Tax=Gossypium arboreum TaxID=29729 RepID=A0ABR0QRW3_GOSAR|nr:hypothetical protein PVK06_004396 [Gossypium arboreum]